MSDIAESPVVEFPGWVKIDDRETRTIRYRSPDGVVIPRSRYLKLKDKYGEGRIPPEELLDPKKPPFNFFAETSSKSSSSKSSVSSAQAPGGGAEQQELPEHISDLKPKPASKSKSKKPRPSAAMLSIGIKRLAMLITNVIVFRMLEDERAKLTEQEATALGIALANLLEPTKFNEEWGWIIAETGDWQTVGYILVVYFSRIGDIVKDKRDAKRSAAGVPPPESAVYNGANGQPAGGGASVRQGAALPYANQSPRWTP